MPMRTLFLTRHSRRPTGRSSWPWATTINGNVSAGHRATDLAGDARYTTNPLRVQNRGVLVPDLEAWLKRQSADHWLALLAAAEVPCGPVNTLDRVFSDPQVQSRRLLLDVPHATAGPIRLVGPPWKLTPAPEIEHRPPPGLGQHTAEVLGAWLGIERAEIERLQSTGAV